MLSPSFFAKNWTKYELGGLVEKEVQGNKVILPIWHRITKEELLRHTPALAVKVALTSTASGIPEMAARIAKVVRAASRRD